MLSPYETIFVQLIKKHICTPVIVTSRGGFAAVPSGGNSQRPHASHPSLLLSLSLLLLSEVLNCCQDQYESTPWNIFYPTVVFNIFIKRPINFQLLAPRDVGVCGAGGEGSLLLLLTSPLERGRKSITWCSKSCEIIPKLTRELNIPKLGLQITADLILNFLAFFIAGYQGQFGFFFTVRLGCLAGSRQTVQPAGSV